MIKTPSVHSSVHLIERGSWEKAFPVEVEERAKREGGEERSTAEDKQW